MFVGECCGMSELLSMLKMVATLSRMRFPNWSCESSRATSGICGCPIWSCWKSTPQSRLRTTALTRRLSLTCSMLSRSACPFLPGMFCALLRRFSSDPNWASHFAAYPSPTPGTPGMLSACSPRNEAMSGYWSGVTLYFS